MASTRKPRRRKADLVPPNQAESEAGAPADDSRHDDSRLDPNPLDVSIETRTLLENLAKVGELLARPGAGEEILHRVRAATLARLAALHGVSGIQPPGESCREAGRRFAGTWLATARDPDLAVGDKVPAKSEVDASGAIKKKIKRADPEFANLVSNTNGDIVFKDEEKTGADRMMNTRMKQKLDALATAVAAEWSGVKVRVTEAWDEDNEHAGNSLHYEGRAADLTTSDMDSAKLGRLGRLAVNAGFDWVWYENSAHIHVSVTA
ncbi:MAG: D-Ala-D-Ala carboxypeptidase family metallohydrolase [Comamonas sp.]|uniref:D-Ala-D-Ala carboxypeptidase family metallohydrolase n=1 Tax=Comamonas sp. TaxID=34028 RepID=UPI002FCA3DEB